MLLHWAVLGSTGVCVYWAVLSCTELYLAVLGCTDVYWDAMGFAVKVVPVIQVI